MEIVCPADVNVSDKEDEKVLKYRALAREVSLVPSICGHHSYCFGHSGIVSCHQTAHLQKLPSYYDQLFNQLQQAVILGISYFFIKYWLAILKHFSYLL